MNIVVGFTELENWEKKYIENAIKGSKIKAVFLDSELNQRNASRFKNCNVLAVFVYSSIGKQVLEKLPKISMITTMSTGYDHIDLQECKNRGITVCNVPSYGTDTVAEYTIGFILNLGHKIHLAVQRAKQHDYSLDGLMGSDIRGKVLGVIGPGKIGQKVIHLARSFGMEVIAYSPRPKKNLERKLGFKYVPFNELLKNSDFITLHAPLNNSTRHMINRNNIKLVKRGAYIINTSRGPLVETDALLYALDNGILAGAALDVLESEALVKEEKQLLSKKFIEESDWKNVIREHLMVKNKKVLITPHSAFYSREALIRILDATIENIKAYSRRKKINRVN